jgi:hypothetical protein
LASPTALRRHIGAIRADESMERAGCPVAAQGNPAEKMEREEEVGAAIGGLVHNARKIRPETGAS